MIRRIRYFAALCVVLLGWASQASAQSIDLSGEVAVRSRYVDDELSVYTPSAVVQPELTLTHEPSGCYADVWASVGLKTSQGNEVEYSLGCERSVAEDVTINASVAYYDLFEEGTLETVSAGVSYKEWSLQGYYYIPNDGSEAEGLRIVGSYTQEWEKFFLKGYGVYDTGPYNDVPTIWVVGLQGEYKLASSLSLSASAQVPVIKKDSDPREAQFVASLIWRF